MLGKKFGKITVEKFSHIGKNYEKFWECICDCGLRKKIIGSHLVTGHTKSCGCLLKDFPPTLLHGQCKKNNTTDEYTAWIRLKDRVTNPNNDHFNRYGGRGIKCCDRWMNNYENFFADMGKRPSSLHSIDRIDNDGDYTPENCRWATKKEQARSRCSSRFIEHAGQNKTLAEWAEGAGMDLRALWQRLKRGWGMEKSLKTPLDRKKQKSCLLA